MELVAFGPEGAANQAALVHAIYVAEHAEDVDFAEWRDGLWARHRARPEFDLVVAWEGDLVAGVAWAYIGDRGQYWSDAVAAALPDEIAHTWVGGHLEIVELIVLPDFRRQGVGRALLMSLLNRSRADRALLSVGDAASPARALYHQLGWRALGKLNDTTTVLGIRRGGGGWGAESSPSVG